MGPGSQTRRDYCRRNRELTRACVLAYDSQPDNRQKKRDRNNARYAYIKERIRAVQEQPSDDPESLFYRGAEA